MRRRSLRNAALMLGGALICVQTLVTVLERSAQPRNVDPAFYAEVQQQARFALGSRTFDVGPRPAGSSTAARTP
ncbi:MAG TPA: hypothetical protein VKY24_22810 [Reyranella sp.]|nr:hypothetical protein [Reyranella sp.]